MFTDYLENGCYFLKDSFKPSLVVFVLVVMISVLGKGRCAVRPLPIIAQYLWALWFTLILQTTGMLRVDWPNINRTIQTSAFRYSLDFFEEGFSMMAILNFLLFVPYGILIPLALRFVKWNFGKVLLVALCTSGGIEGIQYLIGRYAQIDDLLMNTIGTLAGYLIYKGASELYRRCRRRNDQGGSDCSKSMAH